MRRLVISAGLVAAVLAPAPRAQPRLAQSLVADGRAMDYTRGLTTMGPRLTGSAGYQRAAEWAAAQLRAAGIERVLFEPFTIRDGWERERATARIVAPVERTLQIAALGWTPSLAGGEIESEVVSLNELEPEKIAAMPSLAGRIVLMPPGDAGGNPATQAARRRGLDAALRAAGARAILSADLDPDNSLSARDRTLGATIGALPGAQIGRDDASAIRDLLNRDRLRIAIELRNRVTPGPVVVRNVIGEVRGRERPDEWLIVGAHLDSWDFATGAQDNATGVAMVL